MTHIAKSMRAVPAAIASRINAAIASNQQTIRIQNFICGASSTPQTRGVERSDSSPSAPSFRRAFLSGVVREARDACITPGASLSPPVDSDSGVLCFVMRNGASSCEGFTKRDWLRRRKSADKFRRALTGLSAENSERLRRSFGQAKQPPMSLLLATSASATLHGSSPGNLRRQRSSSRPSSLKSPSAREAA